MHKNTTYSKTVHIKTIQFTPKPYSSSIPTYPLLEASKFTILHIPAPYPF